MLRVKTYNSSSENSSSETVMLLAVHVNNMLMGHDNAVKPQTNLI